MKFFIGGNLFVETERKERVMEVKVKRSIVKVQTQNSYRYTLMWG